MFKKRKVILLILLAVVVCMSAYCKKKDAEVQFSEEEIAMMEAADESKDAQLAITSIRNVYNIHMQQYGTTENYSVPQAIRDAKLAKEITNCWNFEVIGNPPQRYVATSTSELKSGEGKQVYYDVDNERFHGYGLVETNDIIEF